MAERAAASTLLAGYDTDERRGLGAPPGSRERLWNARGTCIRVRCEVARAMVADGFAAGPFDAMVQETTGSAHRWIWSRCQFMSTTGRSRRAILLKVIAPLMAAVIVLSTFGVVFWSNSAAGAAASTYQQKGQALTGQL